MNHRLALFTLSALAVATAATTCGGDESAATSTTGNGGSGNTTSANGGGDGGVLFPTGGSDGTGGGDACAETTVMADLAQKPVDIIFAVGNNGSLSQEIQAVEDNINQSFAQIIEASGVDYRVILLSRSGSHAFNICIEAPLGGTPMGECANLSNNAQPTNNPGKFYHYSAIVDNNDSWCKLLNSFDGTLPDEYGLAPNGWQDWLRPEAAKVFVLMSDSNTNCLFNNVDLDDGPQQPNMSNIPEAEQSAVDFDTFLLAISPTHFGTAMDRNYTWHNIIGLEPKDPNNAADPWLPTDPLSLVKCTVGSSPVSPGLGYQALSRTTGGLRFPICEWANFSTVFTTIAQGIIDGALLQCIYPLPDPPPGQNINLNTVEVAYTPGGGSAENFTRVAGPSDCAADSYYVLDNDVVFCPDTCTRVRADTSAGLSITYACEITPP